MKTIITQLTIAFWLLIAICIVPSYSQAANIAITGVAAPTASTVTFTISMQYSWNVVGVASSPNNWDAAWVFIKYADCPVGGVAVWQHLQVTGGTVTGGTTATTPLQVDATTDTKGVFIRRVNPGSNTTTAITGNVTLNTTGLVSSTYQFKVFGIEMVYCPTNDFQLSDGWSTGSFNSATITAAMQAAGTTSAVVGGTGTAATIPSTYPMGVNGFYSMKYNVRTLEWVDFFNTLTYDQQAALVLTGAPKNPVGTNVGGTPALTIATGGQGSDITTPKTPAVFTSATSSNTDVRDWSIKAYLAYLDWSGLRPMTEMEYEKACRGTEPRVQGEFVWGTSTAAGGGPSISSTRTVAAATYYGALYMGSSNNSGQFVVNTTNQASTGGTAFTGALGDGALSAAGLADAANWPSAAGVGAGMRLYYTWTMCDRTYYNNATIPATNVWSGSSWTWTYFAVRGVRQY